MRMNKRGKVVLLISLIAIVSVSTLFAGSYTRGFSQFGQQENQQLVCECDGEYIDGEECPCLEQREQQMQMLGQSGEFGPRAQQGDQVGPRAQQGDQVGPRAQQGDQVGPRAQQGDQVGPRAQQGDQVGPRAQQGDEDNGYYGRMGSSHAGPRGFQQQDLQGRGPKW